jgi:hypothetical protein
MFCWTFCTSLVPNNGIFHAHCCIATLQLRKNERIWSYCNFSLLCHILCFSILYNSATIEGHYVANYAIVVITGVT